MKEEEAEEEEELCLRNTRRVQTNEGVLFTRKMSIHRHVAHVSSALALPVLSHLPPRSRGCHLLTLFDTNWKYTARERVANQQQLSWAQTSLGIYQQPEGFRPHPHPTSRQHSWAFAEGPNQPLPLSTTNNGTSDYKLNHHSRINGLVLLPW